MCVFYNYWCVSSEPPPSVGRILRAAIRELLYAIVVVVEGLLWDSG